LGPIFQPDQTGCWDCLSHRLSIHTQALTRLEGELGYTDLIYAPKPHTPSSLHLALDLAVLELEKWLITGQGVLGEVCVLDLMTLQSERHPLTRRPQCPACGAEDYMQTRL